MPQNEFFSESPAFASRTARRGTGDVSLWAINQRLCGTERELRVQFTRIAQLQAQLDLVLGALRRSPHGVDVRMSVSTATTRDT
jgi:hypothetical protein